LPRVKRGKKAVTIYLPEKLVDSLKEVVREKYSSLYGLSNEVELAIKSYLATTYTQAQSTQKISYPFLQVGNGNGNANNNNNNKAIPPKVYQLKEELFRFIIETGWYEEVPQFILDKHLYSAISSLRGTDMRTIKKWTNTLKRYEIIKETGTHQYEFLS
jgi:hypothetical protein